MLGCRIRFWEGSKEFREKVLPEYRDLARGKITKEEFEKQRQLARAQNPSQKMVVGE